MRQTDEMDPVVDEFIEKARAQVMNYWQDRQAALMSGGLEPEMSHGELVRLVRLVQSSNRAPSLICPTFRFASTGELEMRTW